MSRFDELLEKHTTGIDREEALRELKEVFEACFDEMPELRQITLLGQTPSFNDGDVCTHSESVALFTDDRIIDSWIFECAQEDIEMQREELDEGEVLDSDEIRSSLESSLGEGGELRLPSSIDLSQLRFSWYGDGEEVSKRVVKLLSSQKLSQQVYGTNYVISATREDGKLEVTKVDCWPIY